MRTLICGSFAYDHIMVFEDRFKNHILPDKVHMLNVSFLVPTMRREFGGCAGNIAYNLRLIGGDPVPMGTIGEDFAPYAKWMDDCGINRTHLTVCEGTFTGQAFVTTDLDDNQITAFHPGAMNFSHRNTIDDAADIRVGIVSPAGRRRLRWPSSSPRQEFRSSSTPARDSRCLATMTCAASSAKRRG